MAAVQEKKKRTTEASNFTRNINKLNKLFDAAAPSVLVNPQFEKMKDCYEKLEAAHNEFLAATDIDIETDKNGLAYMNGPDERHEQAFERYATYLRTDAELQRALERDVADEVDAKAQETRKQIEREIRAAEEVKFREDQKREFDSKKAQLTSSIAAFKRMTLNVKDTLTNVSVVDRRQEWQKVETEFSLLKKQFIRVVGIDHSQDVTEISKSFEDDAERVYVDAQKQVLSELKDVPLTSGGVLPSNPSNTVNTTIRKEAVRLPTFQGDEKTSPYLKFPIWKKQWDVLIVEYDERWRAGLLFDHVDESARAKYIGYETDYDDAIERLSRFYGDPLKVVSCVMQEVMSPSEIREADYKGLITYSVVLENNFNRLKAMGLEHEMSNTSAMTSIMRRFPRSVGEKWHEHLSVQTVHLKAKPFPVLIEWLKSRKETWECMAAVDIGRSSSSASYFGEERNAVDIGRSSSSASYFGEERNLDARKRCYRCGEEGHVSRFCSKNERSESWDPPKKRKQPSVKKFWCALHKGDPSKRCFSDSCQDLRRTEVQKRIQLLNDNGDCFHCCGDHKPTDCPKKDRVCGGVKEDRGCKRSHKVHELFCAEAKVFSIHQVQSTAVKDDLERVVLLIMQVRSVKRGLVASVFWDLGSTSNFVRDDYAKLCGFKGHKENLSVTTLGGASSDYISVTTYRCSLLDMNGEIERFDAYGMDTITGAVTKIDSLKIQQLFPHLSDKVVRKLQRGGKVDFLIGMSHPSWHPERAEKARNGGDFWLFRGRFGACVGGRHHEIKKGTLRSDSLFTSVHQSYHVATLPMRESCSHELEFCPRRCVKYSIAPLEANVETDMTIPVSSDVCGVVMNDGSSDAQSSEDNVETDMTIPVASDVCGVVMNDGSPDALLDLRVNVVCSDEFENNIQSVVSTSQTTNDVTLNESVTCYGIKASPLTDEDLFFETQSLGTVVEPRCGGCKCSKCPIPGMKYSFKEQQEYDLIQKNLFYNEEQKRWFTEYPWASERNALPRNEKAALQSLFSLEQNLRRSPELAEDYCQQIKDMVDRGVAIVLSEEELRSWRGDYYYLPLLGVKGKKKWLRVVFDASRRQGGFPSMNDCLCKGPDRFMNNLLSVLLGFRNGRVAAAADLRKFHNQVYLTKEDVHMQRFMWRDMETDEVPKTYAVAVNNFGVKPANCIATSALHKSADCFAEIYPDESQEIKDQTYVDDELVAAPNIEELHVKTGRMDEICRHANMPNKGWTYTGDKGVSGVTIDEEVDACDEKVLGMSWSPISDSFDFHVTLKLKTATGEVSVSSLEDFQRILDSLILTRRVLLANVSRIFDPIGFLVALLLESKLLMRESWCGEVVGWDDPVPPDQSKRWLAFLSSLLSLGDVKFARSLWPEDDVVGLPVLIIFSDGAVLAFGAAAYIRWELKSGGFWSRLVMAKCRIAPKNILSIPRMELNGAVIGNRMKNFILKETNLQFSKVYQLVDSSTVLGYVQKECGTFKPYEGVRVAEIQSSNKFVDGALVGWAWVSGSDNPADWCTKPRSVDDIHNSSFWVEGPEFLKHDESTWPLRFTYKKDNFEGELQISRSVKCLHVQVYHPDFLGRLVHRSSSWTKVVRVLAWILRFLDSWFHRRAAASNTLDADELSRARTILIKYSQRELVPELEQAVNNGKGKFRKLAPILDKDGVWRVGSRMRIVPFTVDAKLPALLPHDHRVTLLIMRKAHQHSHVGQDGTVARFRCEGFWTVRCGHLAKSVTDKCVTCRKMSQRTLNQQMGDIPEERLKDPVAWGYCQMDLFGPFSCRGDVNPRTTKKTWGMVIEDVNSGAVHLDIMQDYSSQAVMLTLRRFGALRGWPGVISTDPGSQLESAGGKLEEWWSTMGDSLCTLGGAKNFKWKLSPADSPWRQGKAERRIAIVKKCIALSIGDSRVTPVEFQSILMEIANICNERPIGLSKPRADGTYTLITPNQLLLGRSCNTLPDDTQMVEDLPMTARYRLVHHVTSNFWKQWSAEVSPGLVVRQKWHEKSRNLCVGDLVMICESTKLKAKYKLGIIDGVTVGTDGNIRSATIRYVLLQKNSNGADNVRVVRVSRSVQRLVLILPIEEQDTPLVVTDNEITVQCAAQS